MARLGEILQIAGAFAPGSGIGKVGDILTQKRERRHRKKRKREALAIQRERNEIMRNNKNSRAY
tara:strand:+ start:1310 stop:1501 length:192 start_codon:yes stop_codon:yes gene_type:complete